MEKRTKVLLAGGAVLIVLGIARYLYNWKIRRQRTDFMKKIDTINEKINEKMYDNPNPYLAALFASFSTESQKQRDEFEKIKKQKMSQKQLTSDPLLPPFEKGVYIADISTYHSLIFDLHARVKGQIMITTKNFVYHNLPLDAKDFEAALTFINAHQGFVLYNWSNYERYNHKHIYAFSYENYTDTIE